MSVGELPSWGAYRITFSCEFCEISKNTFFTEHVWATASLSFQSSSNSVTALMFLNVNLGFLTLKMVIVFHLPFSFYFHSQDATEN